MSYVNLSNRPYVVTDLLSEPDFYDNQELAIEEAAYLSAETGRTYFVCDIIETVKGEHPYTVANESSFLVGENLAHTNPFEDSDGVLDVRLFDDVETAAEQADEIIENQPEYSTLTVYQVTPLFNVVRTCSTVREY